MQTPNKGESREEPHRGNAINSRSRSRANDVDDGTYTTIRGDNFRRSFVEQSNCDASNVVKNDTNHVHHRVRERHKPVYKTSHMHQHDEPDYVQMDNANVNQPPCVHDGAGHSPTYMHMTHSTEHLAMPRTDRHVDGTEYEHLSPDGMLKPVHSPRNTTYTDLIRNDTPQSEHGRGRTSPEGLRERGSRDCVRQSVQSNDQSRDEVHSTEHQRTPLFANRESYLQSSSPVAIDKRSSSSSVTRARSTAARRQSTPGSGNHSATSARSAETRRHSTSSSESQSVTNAGRYSRQHQHVLRSTGSGIRQPESFNGARDGVRRDVRGSLYDEAILDGNGNVVWQKHEVRPTCDQRGRRDDRNTLSLSV